MESWLPVVGIVLGSTSVGALVSWWTSRGRDTIEVKALRASVDSDITDLVVEANRKRIEAELRADIADGNAARLQTTNENLVERIGRLEAAFDAAVTVRLDRVARAQPLVAELAVRLGEGDATVVELRRILTESSQGPQAP